MLDFIKETFTTPISSWDAPHCLLGFMALILIVAILVFTAWAILGIIDTASIRKSRKTYNKKIKKQEKAMRQEQFNRWLEIELNTKCQFRIGELLYTVKDKKTVIPFIVDNITKDKQNGIVNYWCDLRRHAEMPFSSNFGTKRCRQYRNLFRTLEEANEYCRTLKKRCK